MFGELLVQHQPIGGYNNRRRAGERQSAGSEPAHRCDDQANTEHHAPKRNRGSFVRAKRQRRDGDSRE